jgi:putative hydrolase of the HAD superfamily
VTRAAAKTGDIQAVIRALMWDIGGVLLTNGWGHDARAEAVRLFRLDAAEFAERHEEARVPFELGALTLDTYMDRTVFYEPRDFSPAAFRDFMFANPASCILRCAASSSSSPGRGGSRW